MDSANLPHSWCAITALSQFNYTKGGHLVLEELKLVIEFPPGVTTLIPSTCITHANIPIAWQECCYSFTQFTSSSIFCWVDHKFMSEPTFWSSLSEEEYALEVEKEENQLENGLNLLHRWEWGAITYRNMYIALPKNNIGPLWITSIHTFDMRVRLL